MTSEPIPRTNSDDDPNPKEFTLTLTIASKLDHVWMIRAALAGILGDLKAPSSEVFLIQLAVSEIVSNVIEHAYQCRADNKVDISICGAGRRFRIDIADDASPFSLDKLEQLLQETESEEQPDENWPDRGHGLQVVRQAVDSLSYSRVGDRNLTTLIKQISVNCSND